MRKHLFWKAPLALMAVLAGAGVTAASAADVDLIGHWAFDDGAGIAAVDSAGTNDGVLVGGPTWQTVGRIGGAKYDCITGGAAKPNSTSFCPALS